MDFSQRLKELRAERNISQEKLGNIVGVSGRTIGYYESGDRFPHEDTLKNMSTFFDVSMDYLLGMTNVRNNPITFAAHTHDELDDEGLQKLEEFREFLLTKYRK